MQVATDCVNVRVPRESVAAERARVIDEIDNGMDVFEQIRTFGVMPTQPAAAYKALFAEILDPWIVGRIQGLYMERANMFQPVRRQSRGWIYVFRDVRNGPNEIKLGLTRQKTPEQRLAQWRRELGDGDGTALSMLFAVPTTEPVLAEAILHLLLWCRQLVGRINRLTDRQLVEFFYVEDVVSLRYLCRAVARHVDGFVAAATM